MKSNNDKDTLAILNNIKGKSSTTERNGVVKIKLENIIFKIEKDKQWKLKEIALKQKTTIIKLFEKQAKKTIYDTINDFSVLPNPNDEKVSIVIKVDPSIVGKLKEIATNNRVKFSSVYLYIADQIVKSNLDE